MNAVDTAEKLRAYIWATMEVMDRHKDRPDIVETGKEKIDTLLAAEEAVKKQIPEVISRVDMTKPFLCPTCNAERSWKDGNFCMDCGQRLEWKS